MLVVSVVVVVVQAAVLVTIIVIEVVAVHFESAGSDIAVKFMS